MAISYDNSTKTYISGLTTSTFSHTCTGSNLFLFIVAGKDCSNITYNGVSLTLIATNNGSSTNPIAKLWGLSKPPTGAHNVSVTNSYDYPSDVVVISYAGVDPIQAQYFLNNGHNPPSDYVTSLTDYVVTTTNNSWIATFLVGTNSGRNFTAGAGTTLRQSSGTSIYSYSVGVLDSNGAKTPTGTYTLISNWETGLGNISSIAVAIKPYLAITLTGPASGDVNSASTDFTVTPDVAINGTVTITPSGDDIGVSPVTLTFNNSSTPQTFTYTPTSAGVATLTLTNEVGLNNSSPITYTANPVVPLAPTIGVATPLNASASITFTDNSDGGASITSHRAISTPGSFTGTGTSPITVSGLSNGTSYTFTVRATNSVGNSSESSASNAVVPYVPASSFTFTGPSTGNVRAASTNFTVTPNATFLGSITITPTGVGSTGLSPTTLSWNLSSAAQTFTITPLQSGTITLTCTNSNGITNASPLIYTASAVVPLAPSIGLASPSQSSARVSFTAPTNDGGSPITLYTVTSTPDSKTSTTNTPGTVNVLGLTNGTSYTFAVTATNTIGTSASSSASNAVIPTASSTSFTNSGPKFNITKGVGNLIQF